MVQKEAPRVFQDRSFLTRELQSSTEVRLSLCFDNAMHYLRRFGNLEAIETQMGNAVILLPTREVSINALIPENWEMTTQMGNFRSVRSVDRLQDGTKPYIVAKSSERIFSRDPKALSTGDIWWGGKRSLQKGINLGINPIVEEQTMWETVMLLELNAIGVYAELPQAIIEYADGRKELVVREVPQSFHAFGSNNDPSYDKLIDLAKEHGFVPEDATNLNCLRDEEGYTCIIDINRWEWLPHTNQYRAVLLDTIRSAVVTIQ